jgi:hypothetical protein
METNRVQVRHSVRTTRTVSCLRANMKEYAACERRMHHSLGPRLREYQFEVVNGLLTVPRAVGNLAGSPILPQLETTEEVKGAPQLTGRVFTTMILMHERTCEHRE